MMPKIDHYAFGRMTVNGRDHQSDLVIYPDGRVQDNWRRQRGHDLVPADIAPVLDAAPGRLIVGTGAYGRMSVDGRVLAQCRAQGIAIEALPTAEAVKRFNAAAETDASVAGCFHLTC